MGKSIPGLVTGVLRGKVRGPQSGTMGQAEPQAVRRGEQRPILNGLAKKFLTEPQGVEDPLKYFEQSRNMSKL